MKSLCVAVFAALCWAPIGGAAESPDLPYQRVAADNSAPAEPAFVEQIGEAWRRFEANPDRSELAGRLGMIFHAYQLIEPARACYAEAVEMDPQSPRWRYYHAVALTALGRGEQARAEIDRVLAEQPELAAATALRAELLAVSGDISASEADWRRAVELAPESSAAHYGLGRALAAQGRGLEAVTAFRRAIAIDSNPQARYGLALAYRRAGREEEAAKALEAYRSLDTANRPSVPDPWMDEVRALNRSVRNQVSLGADLARSGRTDEALDVFNAILETSPNLAVAHANLVALYTRRGDEDKAADHYRRAIAIDPHETDAHFNWAGALARQGRWQEAAEALERAVAAGPHSGQARIQLGQLYERLGRPEDALEQYLQAADGDPLNLDAQRLLGAALVSAGRVEEGLDALEKAVDVDDGRAAEYMEGLSRAHEEDGRYELALGYARRALRHGPGDELEKRLQAAMKRLEAKLEAAR